MTPLLAALSVACGSSDSDSGQAGGTAGQQGTNNDGSGGAHEGHGGTSNGGSAGTANGGTSGVGGNGGSAGSATTPTLVDCTSDANSSNPVCSVPDDAGTVGKGPKFQGGLTTSVNDGFVDGNRLILAVELTGSDDNYGGIFAVDLATGDRTLVSGTYNDTVNGDVTKGTGDKDEATTKTTSLNNVRDVTKLPDGSYLAYVPDSPARLVSIDPATGNRTLRGTAPKAGCKGIAKSNVAFDPLGGVTAGPDGALYFILNNNPEGSGKGVAKVTGDSCEVLTLSGADTSSDNKGKGPTMIGSFIYDLTYFDGKLYTLQFNTHSSIISIDPTSGDRTMVSVAPDKGTGDDLADRSLAVGPGGTFWAYSAENNGTYGLTAVDVATGNRTAHDPKGGPAKQAQGDDHGVWLHPDGKHLLLQYANSILIYDPETDNSNTLSY